MSTHSRLSSHKGLPTDLIDRDDRKRKRDACIESDKLKQSLAISEETCCSTLKLAKTLEEEEMLKASDENCQRKEEEVHSLKSQIEGLAKQYSFAEDTNRFYGGRVSDSCRLTILLIILKQANLLPESVSKRYLLHENILKIAK